MQSRAILRTLSAVALAAATAACASSGARPRPFPTPGSRPAPEPPVAAPPSALPTLPADGFAIASTALQLQGVPYRFGGADPSGFDCSGLVQYVLRQHGISVPRLVRDQYSFGSPVDDDELQPGDLVFFRTQGREVSHVGIVIGADRFVHAPAERGVVRTESLATEYWSRRLAGGRRLMPEPEGSGHQ